MKILGQTNSRTVMMERFQDTEFSWHCYPQKTVMIPRSICLLYLLFTQPSLIRSFHSSDPCFSVSCPKGVGYARVYCNYNYINKNSWVTVAHRLVYTRHCLQDGPQTPELCYVRFRYLMVSGSGSRNRAYVLMEVGEETPSPQTINRRP